MHLVSSPGRYSQPASPGTRNPTAPRATKLQVVFVVGLLFVGVLVFIFESDVQSGRGLSSDLAVGSTAPGKNGRSTKPQTCLDYACCLLGGGKVVRSNPAQCHDPVSGVVFTDGGEDSQQPLQAFGPRLDRFVAMFQANQTIDLANYRTEMEDRIAKFQEEQRLRMDATREELAAAAAALATSVKNSASLRGGDGLDESDALTTPLSEIGIEEDSWAFMIPVIKSNPRRQRRLVNNICALTWPPKLLISVNYLVDKRSLPLVEETRDTLFECGVTRVVIFEDPPQKYVQPSDAHARHELYAQFERRASIAAARNFLLHNSLRQRHTSVVWIDSDLMIFSPDSLWLLQQTGGYFHLVVT